MIFPYKPTIENGVPPINYPYAPWYWNIYLQNWAIFGVNVGIHIPAPWFASGLGNLQMNHWFPLENHGKSIVHWKIIGKSMVLQMMFHPSEEALTAWLKNATPETKKALMTWGQAQRNGGD